MTSAADNNDNNDNKTDSKNKSKRSSGKLMLIVAAIVVALSATAAGSWWVLARDDNDGGKVPPKTSQIPAPAQYFAMDPPFVVNLNGPEDGPRYLQTEVQLMTRDPESLKAISNNAPAIRAHLLILLSGLQTADIADTAGRRRLQKTALAEAQRVMTAETGKRCVEDLLFTSFVTQ